MDATQLAAFAAAISALPINAFLIIVIVILWKRLNAVTDQLMEVKAARTDDANKLQDNPTSNIVAQAPASNTLPDK